MTVVYFETLISLSKAPFSTLVLLALAKNRATQNNGTRLLRVHARSSAHETLVLICQIIIVLH